MCFVENAKKSILAATPVDDFLDLPLIEFELNIQKLICVI